MCPCLGRRRRSGTRPRTRSVAACRKGRSKWRPRGGVPIGSPINSVSWTIGLKIWRPPPARAARTPAATTPKSGWISRTCSFIHLHHETLPPHQLRRNLYERCRFLGLHGCTLPRLSRPWICTWYICPTQRQALERDVPGGMVQLTAMMSRVKFLREEMEQRFLTALGLTPAV